MTCGRGSHGECNSYSREERRGKRGEGGKAQGRRDRGEATRQGKGEAWRCSSNHEMLGTEFPEAGSRDTARRASRVHHLWPGTGRGVPTSRSS